MARWWSTQYTRDMATDQHYFSTLWYTNPSEFRKHIAFLRPDALNTHFPAWVHQKPYNQVLHLAGCSSLFRRDAFMEGLGHICQCTSNEEKALQSQLPIQLGLSKDVLCRLETKLPLLERADEILLRMRAFHGDIDSNFTSETVHGFRQELMNMFRHADGSTTDISTAQTHLTNGLRMVYEMFKRRLTQSMTMDEYFESNQLNSTTMATFLKLRVQVLEDVLSSGFDLAVRLQRQDEEAILLEIGPWIDEVVSLAREYLGDRYKFILYYDFKHKEFLSAVYSDLGDVSKLEFYLYSAIQLWKEMHSLQFYGYGRGVMYADPYSEGIKVIHHYAIRRCTTGNFKEAMALFQECKLLHDEILDGPEVLP